MRSVYFDSRFIWFCPSSETGPPMMSPNEPYPNQMDANQESAAGTVIILPASGVT